MAQHVSGTNYALACVWKRCLEGLSKRLEGIDMLYQKPQTFDLKPFVSF